MTLKERIAAAAHNRSPMPEVKPCADCGKTAVTPEELDRRAAIHNPTIGVVIASRGHPQLQATIDSLLRVIPTARIVVLDDTDDGRLSYVKFRPVGATTVLRAESRLGCSGGRYYGSQWFFQQLIQLPEVLFFTDDHMAFTDDDPRVVAFRAAGHENFHVAGNIQSVANVAAQIGGIAYCGINDHCGASLRQPTADERKQNNEDALLHCKWLASKPDRIISTSGMMGATYCAATRALQSMGGWIALPGYIGFDEEAMSILAARCEIPIVCVPYVMAWHLFDEGERSAEYGDHNGFLLNQAAVYRLLFDDPMWTLFRAQLAETVPENVLLQAETPELLDYGRTLRKAFKQSDLEFLLGRFK